MINKKLVKTGATLALAIAITVPALSPAAAITKENLKIESVKFNGMKAPSTIDEMVKTYTTATIDVKYSNGKVKTFPLSYNYLFKSEDKIATVKGEKIPAGTPIDVKGNPIVDPSGSDGKYFVSDAPDSNSLLMPIDGKIYMVTHYEYQTVDAAGKSAYGLVPASMSLAELSQDSKTGELKEKSVKKIDFSAVNGLWIPCNGSLSPWNTHLGSEEYEPDARQFADTTSKTRSQVETFAQFYFGDKTKGNPYFYGYSPEITVNKKGEASVVKHYSTGRFSHELMKVMPDNRTVYFGDDGTNTGLFMYVADKEKDLSAGTLYAAKFKQTGTENGGSGDLEWIDLGHATDKEVKNIIDSGITFDDIFETSNVPAEGFTAIKQYSYGNVEYLKLKPGKEKAAAFLETRRYAAMLGATTEFNKMEGVALNEKDKKIYIAISDQSKSMEKDATGKDPADHIQLPKIKAGATYQLDLQGGQKDSKGKSINSSYVAPSMYGLVIGEDLPNADAYGNTANVDKVANPDNLSYSEAMRTLFIGEDSGAHTNNFVWAYNVDTKELNRVLSVPAGAEATGLSAVDDSNDFSYIFSNFQHPGDEVDGKSITAVNKAELLKAVDEQIGINKTGGIGYISGLPSLTKMPDFTAPGVPVINTVTNVAPLISGKAEANSTVKLYINGKYKESVKADKNGNYKFKLDKKLSEGIQITVTATDEAGNTSAEKTTKVVDKHAPKTPVVNKVTVKSTAVTGTTEKDTTVSVYNGKTLLGKAVADSKGNFVVKIKAQKANTNIIIVAKDKAGNQNKSTVIKIVSK